MTLDELQRFCADDDDLRYYLCTPWSRGERTYASNGCILVHVPRIAEVLENESAPDTTKLLEKKATPGQWMPVPETAMPPYILCRWCQGSGRAPEDSRYKCHECDGAKTEPDHSTHTKVGAVAFANRYLALIQGWEIAPSDASSPAPIRRGDAEGLLMPMRIA